MARKMQYASMGSVSSGTMRTEDLIPAFLDELEYHAKRNHRKDHLAEVKRIREASDAADYYETDDAGWNLNETLFDALNEYALPYFYFGAHPGDGADYGFWLTDGFEYDFDGLKVSDTSEIPRGYTGEVLLVSDHGNMTLFNVVRGRKYELWGIV